MASRWVWVPARSAQPASWPASASRRSLPSTRLRSRARPLGPRSSVTAVCSTPVTSPESAIAFGKLGGLPVLDLEGLWTRYDDPTFLLAEIASLDPSSATARLQQIYAEPIKPALITERLRQVREAGVTVAGALSPQRTQEFWETV